MKKNRQIPQRKCRLTSYSPECDSATTQYLLESQDCLAADNDNHFTMLIVARSPFHLVTFEATFIKIKQSALCRRKEFIYTLQLVHYRLDFGRRRNETFRYFRRP